jgi:hypothetical protein
MRSQRSGALLPTFLNRQHGGIDGGHAHVAATASVAAEASTIGYRPKRLAATGSLADLLNRARLGDLVGRSVGLGTLLSLTPTRSELALAVLATE